MTPKKKKYSLPAVILGGILVVVAAYYSAAAMEAGETIFIWIEKIKIILEDPFQVYFNAYTVKTVAVFLAVYALLMMMYITSKRNYLPGREMGSAQYADVRMVNKKLADHHNAVDDPENIVIARTIRRRR